MRGNLAAFRSWASDEVEWAQWAKPAIFANMTNSASLTADSSKQAADFAGLIPELDWISRADPETAVIIDLHGKSSVLEGLALARLGYRPVPLYNGVRGMIPESNQGHGRRGFG